MARLLTKPFLRDSRGLEVSHTDADLHEITTVRDLRGLPTTVTTTLVNDTNAIIKSYDGLQKLNARTDQDSNQTFDSNSRVVKTVDANGNTSWHVYNQMDQLCFDISATGIVRGYQYNALHKLSECLYQNTIDVTQIPANPTPQSIQSLIQSTPNDTMLYYFYDLEEKLIFTVTSLGFVTETLYDGVPRKHGTCRYATAINVANITLGNLLAVQNQLIPGPTDRYDLTIYNAAGKAQYHIDPMGMVTEYVLDADYNRTQIIRYAVPINVTTQESWTPSLVAQAVNPSDPNNRVIYQIFDGFNRQNITQTADGRQWITERDLNDQIISEQAPTDPAIGVIIQRSTYNEAKEQVTQTTPLGHTSATNFDDRGNVEQTINACSEMIKYQSDRNNQTTLIDDGGSLLTNGVASVPVLYQRDYFGNLDTTESWQIRDKSGAQYIVTLDYNKLILTKTCTTATCTENNGAHGQCIGTSECCVCA